jgi:hypothetical protein
MSAISTFHDGVETWLSALFTAPTYKRLVNPYTIESDVSLNLNRGWTFVIGPKTPANLTTGRYWQFNVNLQVIQTISQKGTDRDITIRQTAEKLLLEDQFTMLDSLRTTTTFDTKVWNLEYESDNGLEFVFTEQQNYYKIVTNLTAIISEGC